MPCRFTTAATFRALEQQLLADLRAAGATDPLAPKWVVVPSATLVNHLRVRLAAAAGETPLANVRVVNLPRFAEQLATALTGRPTPAWDASLDLMLFELVAKLPARSPLARLKTISGGAALLREAFTDLAEAGFGPADLDKITALAEEPDLAAQEREVLRLFARWAALVEQRGRSWAPFALQALAEPLAAAAPDRLAAVLRAETGQQPAVVLYGFYDWIDVHLGWIAALAERVSLTIYYPWLGTGDKTHPAFSFAQTVRDHVRSRITFDEETALPPPADTDSATWFVNTFPEGTINHDQPSFVSCQCAAGIRAEAIAAALRVRRWIDEDQLDPATIMVVAPQADEHVEAVQQIFRSFAIPLRIADVPAGTTPETEHLQMLGRLWEEEAPAEWVLALLRAQPNLPAARGVDVDAFERKVRALGIWGGSTWRTALTHKNQTANDPSTSRRQTRFNQAEQRFIRNLLHFVAAEDHGPPPQLSVDAALNQLRVIQQDWLNEPSLLAPLIAAIEEAACHCPNLMIDLAEWTRLLAECGGQHTLRDAPSQAVLFTPLMRARGVTARAVVILGLSAGQFPHRVQDDPLLSEAASEKLARWAEDLGHRFPVKEQATEELQLLFFLVNTAAERVHWVVPETDAAGKEVAPSPWVQRYLQHWGRTAADRIARAPFEQAVYLAGLDPRRGAWLPPDLAMFAAPQLATVDPFLADSIARRGRDRAWSGCLGQRPVLPGNRVSVTALEALARCPYRFYAQTVAGWNPVEVLALSRGLDPLARGGLLHQLLEESIQPHAGNRTLGDIAGDLLANDAAQLWAVAERLSETAPETAFALASLPNVFRRAALREVVQLARAYLASVVAADTTPRGTEQKFTRPFPGLTDLEVVGKIDRIDDGSGGVGLVDYKSGRRPTDLRKQVRLGWLIQAALYPWLCREPQARFEYAFLGGRKPETGDAGDAPDAEEFLQHLAPVLAEGRFLPLSNQVTDEQWDLQEIRPCRYCHFASACRRFEPGSAAHHAGLLADLLPGRVAAMRAVGRAGARGGRAG